MASQGSDGPFRGDEAVLPAYLGLFAQRGRRDLNQRKQVVELYDEIRPSLYAYLSSLGFKPSVAEDIIQETFLRLFDHLVEGRPIENARAWTFRVAHNLALNLHRDDRRLVFEQEPEHQTQALLDPSLTPEELLLKKEQVARVRAVAACLTLQQQRCLHLRAEGLRYREIAEVLGVSVQRVGDLVQRALAALASAAAKGGDA